MVSVYDFIRSVALVIGVGFTAQQDRKTWMWGDSVLWGAYSVALFVFPGFLFPGVDSGMAMFNSRLLACAIFATVTFEYLSRNSRDESVTASILWGRLLSSIFVLMMFLYSYFQNPEKFADKSVYFDLEAFGLLFLSSLYQFWRGEYRAGGRETRDSVGYTFRALFVLMLANSLLFLAFPAWCTPYHKMTGMETLIARMFGGFFLGRAFMFMYAPTFRYDDDKRNLLISVLVAQLVYVVLLNLAYFVNGLFDAQQMLSLHAAGIYSVICLLGLNQLRKTGTQSDYNLRSKSN